VTPLDTWGSYGYCCYPDANGLAGAPGAPPGLSSLGGAGGGSGSGGLGGSGPPGGLGGGGFGNPNGFPPMAGASTGVGSPSSGSSPDSDANLLTGEYLQDHQLAMSSGSIRSPLAFSRSIVSVI
jgi:hypothetical protein